nr:hypothetical protein [Lachnospiraceae bacterium]
WSTDSTNIATVSSSGKVTAKKTGNTKIHCEVAGRDVFTAIYVYQLKNLNFSNKKTTLTATYRNKDTRWDNDRDTISLTVNQNNRQVSAQSLYLFDSNLKYPTASSSNKSVAEVSIGEGDFHGDTIDLRIVPKKTGKTTITVKFGGKTAKLTYNVKQDLMDTEDEKWFSELPYTEVPYKEKAYKPVVITTEDCPKLKRNKDYKISYANNINAGTATVTIKGTGNYSGTVTRTFKITPRDLSYSGEYTCTESKRYTGSAVKPKITVTYKKNTLVKNKDYKVSFKQGFKYIDNPVNAGKYTVVIEGINNYEGTMDPAEFEIKKIASADLSLSCPEKVKWKNDSVVTPNIKLMYGDYVIPQIIEGAAQQNYEIEYYKVENGNRKKEVPARKGTYVAVLTLFPNTGNISISTNEKTGEKIESLEKTFVIK